MKDFLGKDRFLVGTSGFVGNGGYRLVVAAVLL